MGIRPSILVQLDKPRHLRYSTNGMIEAKELSGIDILDIDSNAKRVSLEQMRALIYAALWEEDETLTLRQVGVLADDYEGGLPALFVKAMEAVQLAFGGGDQKNVQKPKAKPITAAQEK